MYVQSSREVPFIRDLVAIMSVIARSSGRVAVARLASSSIRAHERSRHVLRRKIHSTSLQFLPHSHRVLPGRGPRGGSLLDVAGSPIIQSVSSDFRPRRIILVRHGESQGNIDDNAYVDTPDWKVSLTDRGHQQASAAGKQLKELIGDSGRVFFYYSPYKRTTQTLENMSQHLDDEQIVSVREEPRMSEQQFGNFQNVEQVLNCKEERHSFGRFYYRFPSGEAGLDVYSRVSSFITTLVRDCHQYSHAGQDLDTMNVVIVTHGLALRLFLMRWFQFSVEEFDNSTNPGNAQLITMLKHVGKNGHKWYELDPADRDSLNLPAECGVPKNVHLHKLTRSATCDEPIDG
mmetsp:Transcript_16208/g.36033  ORF Transcript_16208/g.36033 Transcript_16208/m.36033 type:complete len:346 (-) Transcript_16208:153-1190(-)